jgi:hypothetical protein
MNPGFPGPSRAYPYLGRTDDYTEFQLIEPGRKITAIETWTQGAFAVVRLTEPMQPVTSALNV